MSLNSEGPTYTLLKNGRTRTSPIVQTIGKISIIQLSTHKGSRKVHLVVLIPSPGLPGWGCAVRLPGNGPVGRGRGPGRLRGPTPLRPEAQPRWRSKVLTPQDVTQVTLSPPLWSHRLSSPAVPLLCSHLWSVYLPRTDLPHSRRSTHRRPRTSQRVGVHPAETSGIVV